MTIITSVDLLKMRRTKIIATIGPASQSEETIRALIDSGVNVFRLNMSHGDHDTHQKVYSRIRSISRSLQSPVAVLADLCGPKIRTGKFKNDKIELKSGEKIIVTTRDVLGEDGLIPSQYELLARDVRSGDKILLSDGEMEFEVVSVDAQWLSEKPWIMLTIT